MLAPLTKYRPVPVADPLKPLLVLGVTNVVALDDVPAIPADRMRVSAAGKWTREVYIPRGTAGLVAGLATRYSIVWASEWGPNAHIALHDVLDLPDRPWPYLPVQFDKIGFIQRFAAGRRWVWVDDPVVDLGELPTAEGGTVLRVDPLVGLVGVDLGA
ncbi:hypothetical protein [Leifsonia poae]|uniref:hypothetical protein n=1 Tax=Leifsonia poae TaxID=110933 RepID=UPI001CBDCF1A|nr:hypothetical protein [Leifsonia poae]